MNILKNREPLIFDLEIRLRRASVGTLCFPQARLHGGQLLIPALEPPRRAAASWINFLVRKFMTIGFYKNAKSWR